MSLANNYIYVYGQLSDILDRIQEGQAPDKFTIQLLRDWDFTSSSYRACIPLLKSLNFLTDDGSPTPRYHEYRNRAQSKRVIAEALREAYSDIFVIKEKPTESDRDLIEGKFKSTHNTSDRTAKLMANTFFALLDLADLSKVPEKKTKNEVIKDKKGELPPKKLLSEKEGERIHTPSLNYNIQIHLPATKDVEVYNAIFKSLKEHLIE